MAKPPPSSFLLSLARFFVEALYTGILNMPFPLQVTDFLLCSPLAMINSYNCNCNQGESQNSKIWLQGLGSSLLLRRAI